MQTCCILCCFGVHFQIMRREANVERQSGRIQPVDMLHLRAQFEQRVPGDHAERGGTLSIGLLPTGERGARSRRQSDSFG